MKLFNIQNFKKTDQIIFILMLFSNIHINTLYGSNP